VSPPRKRPERTEVGLGPKERERRSTEAPSERAKARRLKGNQTRPLRSDMLSPLAAPPPPSVYSSKPPGSGSYRERKRDSIEIITNRPPARSTGRFGVTQEIVQPSMRPDPRREDEAQVSPPAHPTPQMLRAPHQGRRTAIGVGARSERVTPPRGEPVMPPRSERVTPAHGEHVTPPARPTAERTAAGMAPAAFARTERIAKARSELATPPARPAERTAVGVAPDPAATAAHIIELIEGLGDEDEARRRNASDALRQLTGVHFGFVAEASKRERDTAQRRYRDWWLSEGRQRFR